MVTYILRSVCGGRTATLVPQTVLRPYGFYANRTATSRCLARRKVIASLVFLILTLNYFSETAMTQHRNHTTRSPYGGRTVALRWPRGGKRFVPCLGCLENRTAVTSRSPCGHLPFFYFMNRTIVVRSS